MTNAERQRRYRERQAASEPVRTVVHPKDRRPRPKRWADAGGQLRTLQAEYEAWRDQLPESLDDSRTAELPEGVCDVDLDALDAGSAGDRRARACAAVAGRRRSPPDGELTRPPSGDGTCGYAPSVATAPAALVEDDLPPCSPRCPAGAST